MANLAVAKGGWWMPRRCISDEVVSSRANDHKSITKYKYKTIAALCLCSVWTDMSLLMMTISNQDGNTRLLNTLNVHNQRIRRLYLATRNTIGSIHAPTVRGHISV